MTIYSGSYIKEISIEANTTKNIFVNFNSIFEPIESIYILVNGQWELISGKVIVKDDSLWYNLTDQIEIVQELDIDLLNVLTENNYNLVLSDEDYNKLLY